VSVRAKVKVRVRVRVRVKVMVMVKVRVRVRVRVKIRGWEHVVLNSAVRRLTLAYFHLDLLLHFIFLILIVSHGSRQSEI